MCACQGKEQMSANILWFADSGVLNTDVRTLFSCGDSGMADCRCCSDVKAFIQAGCSCDAQIQNLATTLLGYNQNTLKACECPLLLCILNTSGLQF